MTAVVDKQEIARTRVFNVCSIDQVADVLRMLKSERFFGRVVFHFGPGGTPQSVEVEERTKL
jgi:hypothetical protein